MAPDGFDLVHSFLASNFAFIWAVAAPNGRPGVLISAGSIGQLDLSVVDQFDFQVQSAQIF